MWSGQMVRLEELLLPPPRSPRREFATDSSRVRFRSKPTEGFVAGHPQGLAGELLLYLFFGDFFAISFLYCGCCVVA